MKKQWYELWVKNDSYSAHFVFVARVKSIGLANLIMIFLKTIYDEVERR